MELGAAAVRAADRVNDRGNEPVQSGLA